MPTADDLTQAVAAARAKEAQNELRVTTVLSTLTDARTPEAMSYAALVDQADVITGHALERDKSMLLGIPHVITAVTIRDGVPRNKQPSNYVSVEAVVADTNTIAGLVRSGRLSIEQAVRVTPNEMIVYNDGSTGITRQVVTYLHTKGYVIVPEGPESGPAGECRWDIYFGDWLTPDGRPMSGDETRFEFVLHCPRGLRVSEYDFAASGDAETYYLA